MRTIKVKPVEIIGQCRANLSPDDEFEIEGMRLKNLEPCNLCFLALGQLPPIISQLQCGKHFFAHATCPDCQSRLDKENHVVFLLGHADKLELCQAISEYCRLCRACEKEPVVSRRLTAEALRYQNQGDYSTATQKMTAALAELKRVIGLQ
jgi:hypothetical protein